MNMYRDRQKTEDILKHGKQLLVERPELNQLSLEEILDELDDETNEMIRYRWGVTAYVVVNSTNNWDTTHLLKHLSSFEGGSLTFEYAGYILLNEHNIDLEKLIIDAEQHNYFDRIIRYVHPNIGYITNPSRISEVLKTLHNHSNHHNYSSFLYNYSNAVSFNNCFTNATKQVGDIHNLTQHKFMCNLCRAWYKYDSSSAERIIETMMSANTFWSKRTAIHYWSQSLDINKSIFIKHFKNIEALIYENEEYWLDIIPSYCEYITTAEDKDKSTTSYFDCLNHLKNIPNDSIKAKCSFMNKMQFVKNTVDEIKNILQVLFSTPCEQNSELLSYIDHYLYYSFKEETLIDTLKYLSTIYSENNYKSNHYVFFNTFDLIKSEIKNHPAFTTDFAISHILSNVQDSIFYGLGLLLECGDISKYKLYKESLPDPWIPFSETELIRIMKTILLFSYSDIQTCQLSFQLIEISTGSLNNYFDYCIKEVYQNYPTTMSQLAGSYLTSTISSQSIMANKITMLHQKKCEQQKAVHKIKDLLPSLEHRLLCSKAQLKHNQDIQNAARTQSIFSDLFTNQHLKYGKRIGHISIDSKGKKTYTTNEPSLIKHEVELSAKQIIDPVGSHYEKIAFLKEVTQDETNN